MADQESFYRDLVERAGSIIVRMDTQGRIVFVNEFAARFFGFDRDELVGQPVIGTIVPETDTAGRDLRAMVEDCCRRPAAYATHENENVTKDERRVWVAWTNGAVCDGDGNPVAIVSVGHDVTDRHRAEEALQLSETRYRALFDGMNLGVAVCEAVDGGADFLTTDFNPAAQRIEQMAWEEAVGHRVTEAFPGLRSLGMLEVLRSVWETGQPRHHPVGQVENQRVTGWRENYVYQLPSGELVAIFEDATERKQAEEALRASEERHRQLFENANDMIVLHGLTPEGRPGQFMEVNDVPCRVLGYEREALLQLSTPGIVAPETPTDARAVMAQLAETGHAVFEQLLVTSDGRRIPVETSSHQYDLAGQPVVLSILRDTSERKQAEEALRRSEERYRRIVETSLEGIVAVDAGAVVTFLNPQMAAMLGYEAEEMLGRRLDEFFVPSERPDHEARMAARRLGRSERCERRFARKDGGEVWVVVSATPLTDEEGQDTGSFGMCVDVTQRKRAEEAQRLLTAAVEQTGDAVLIMDAGLRLTYVNPAFEAATGYSAAEALGRPLQLLRGGDPDGPVFREVRARVEAAEPWSGVLPVRRSDGAVIEAQALLSPLRDDGQRVNGYVLVARDITEQLALEAELRQAQKLEAIGALAGGVAHDFSNLLAAILGHAELLRAADGAPAGVLAAADVVERSALRAAQLTRQLLACARVGTLLNVPVDLHESISETVEILRRTLGAHIEFEVALDAGSAVVMGDPTEMAQVILNLAVNARDAMPGGGRLTIRTASVELEEESCRDRPAATPGRYVRLTVADTGCGVPQADRARVFEPYYTTKPAGEGTGIGLATVRRVVRDQGGFVEIAGEVGEGAVFDVYLPAVAASAVPIVEGPGAALTRGEGRILVVDDDQAVRDVLTRMLEHLGYEVVAFGDPERAVELYRREAREIDLVVLDLVMPKMAGSLCFRVMRGINPGVRAIICSGHGLEGVGQQLLDEGVLALLPKPYQLQRLATVVAGALGGGSTVVPRARPLP